MKKLIFLIFGAVIMTILSNSNEYIEIPSTSIRMRVIANGEDNKSQQEKIVVKSFLEETIYDLIKDKKTIEDVDNVISNKKEYIDSSIKSKMEKVGINSSFTSNYGLNYFPEKEFKGLSYKAGNYKSYVVTLGEGQGENWWCVLYPPLCLIDENNEEYEYHSLIKDTLEKYN